VNNTANNTRLLFTYHTTFRRHQRFGTQLRHRGVINKDYKI